MARRRISAEMLEQAWIGDAVLALYMRRKILREDGAIDGERFERLTSNRCLAVLGEPSSVEAEIGRVYERDGLEAAFAWIEQRLLPILNRQEENRRRGRTNPVPARS